MGKDREILKGNESVEEEKQKWNTPFVGTLKINQQQIDLITNGTIHRRSVARQKKLRPCSYNGISLQKSLSPSQRN